MENNNINNASETVPAFPDQAAKDVLQEELPKTAEDTNALTATDVPGKKKLSDRDVTAHTAAMWKYNPIPEIPEPYPESISRFASSGEFSVTAASVRGKKHKHDGSNRDDSFAFEIIDGMAVAAV